MNNKQKSYLVVLLVIFSFITLFGAFAYYLNSLSRVKDVSVLLNAEIEEGYLSTVQVFRRHVFTQELEFVCSGAQIAAGIAVTAKHCISDSFLYVARGNDGGIAEVEKKYAHSNAIVFEEHKYAWDYGNGGWLLYANDVAILVYDQSALKDNMSATLSTIENGCNYRAVSYGKTFEENENGSFNRRSRPKQGLDVCLNLLPDDNLIEVTSLNAGTCIGDSGGAIFEKGTNKLVAIIVASQTYAIDGRCVVGGKGYAASLDLNRDFLETTLRRLIQNDNSTQENESQPESLDSNELPNNATFDSQLSTDTETTIEGTAELPASEGETVESEFSKIFEEGVPDQDGNHTDGEILFKTSPDDYEINLGDEISNIENVNPDVSNEDVDLTNVQELINEADKSDTIGVNCGMLDYNNSGKVDLADFDHIVRNWNKPCLVQ